MDLSVDIVKRGGKRPTESYERSKLHASIIAVCSSTRTPEGQSQTIANFVCDGVEDWLRLHPEVTSSDIRNIAAKHLKKHHPEAAYLYEQRRITI